MFDNKTSHKRKHIGYGYSTVRAHIKLIDKEFINK